MTHYAISSVAGPRPHNEDLGFAFDLAESSIGVGNPRVLLGVCDGMGGHRHGDAASAAAVAAVGLYVSNHDGRLEPIDPEAALAEILACANDAVENLDGAEDGPSAGSTMVAVLVDGEQASVGHVGDSRAYVMRGNEISRITTDHSLIGRLVAEGTISEEEARSHPRRNVIERALGFGGHDGDFASVALEREDVLLLCSDGLHGTLSDAAIAETLSTSWGPQEAVAQLTARAVSEGASDNVTAVVWSRRWERGPRSERFRKRGILGRFSGGLPA
ncbi:MAG: protein phosphatase 2C domain-containing protein [Coriobacteriia bacterium]|nr:protein phosphatase 2C domain-containing protein [Coriobacteriia bacterium]